MFHTYHFGWQTEAGSHMVEAAWTQRRRRRNPQTVGCQMQQMLIPPAAL